MKLSRRDWSGAKPCGPVFWALLPLAAMALAGCGASLPEVAGKVTVNDQAASAGTVVFHPAGKGVTGYGTIQADGSYTARTGGGAGLPPGDYLVTVMGNKAPPPADKPGTPTVEPLFPPQYADPKTSGLKYTVTEDGGTYDIPLKK